MTPNISEERVKISVKTPRSSVKRLIDQELAQAGEKLARTDSPSSQLFASLLGKQLGRTIAYLPTTCMSTRSTTTTSVANMKKLTNIKKTPRWPAHRGEQSRGR